MKKNALSRVLFGKFKTILTPLIKRHHRKERTCLPSRDKLSIRPSTASAAENSSGHKRATYRKEGTPRALTHVPTYLPLRDSLLLASAIISKAPKSAFYGDPCLSGQFRGALVISLQPARNAPQRGVGGRRALGVGTERTPSGQSVRDAASHEVYLISRGRVLRARLTWSECNGVGRGDEGAGRVGPITELQPGVTARRCSEASE